MHQSMGTPLLRTEGLNVRAYPSHHTIPSAVLLSRVTGGLESWPHALIFLRASVYAALKYQQLQGMLPKDRRYDLFRGGARTRTKDEQEKRKCPHHSTRRSEE